MNIEKATTEYIAMCHNAWVQPTEELFHKECTRCEGYSKAIMHIAGLDIWGEMTMAADLSFPVDVPVCAGIPIYPDYKGIRIHENS